MNNKSILRKFGPRESYTIWNLSELLHADFEIQLARYLRLSMARIPIGHAFDSLIPKVCWFQRTNSPASFIFSITEPNQKRVKSSKPAER